MNYEILRREMICSRLPTAMCHASTVLPLPDGTVLSAWFGGSYEGEGDTSIWTARRADGVWSVPVPIAHVEEPHWNPVLQRLPDGAIRLYYKVGAVIAQWRTMVCASRDGGRTWDIPRELVPGDQSGGRGPVRSKVIQLSSGRLLAPNSTELGPWTAYADRSEYLGDPDFVKVPWQALTNKAYAKSIADQIDINKAKPSSEIRPGKLAPYESNQTTHYSVVDKDGNAVAVTYTLNTTFGTGIVAGESGILLNNQMDDFSAKPGVPNVYGLVGGDANAVGPNKRPLSSMSPTIVVKDGKTWLVTGSPGGSRIITTVLQMVVNSIDYGLNVAEATNAPRFHHQWLPDELRVEKGFSPDTIKLLEAKGQKVALKEAMGSTQSIMVGPDGELYGASDPRSVDDLTAGY